MRILIAPDKFKDALDAPGAAAALAAGVLAARPDAETISCPLGDGGEGTGPLLAAALGAVERVSPVLDPLGRTRMARWWSCPHDALAILEMAEASGLGLLSASERNALHTTSFGTGQLIQAAVQAGCTQLLLCVGGSATVDGGAGCLQALGWELRDAGGRPLAQPLTGSGLSRVGSLLPPATTARFDLRILCDVDNPLLGRRGAAAVFAPQKGATPPQVAQLELGLANWAGVLRRLSSLDIERLAGGGAAGGLPAGLAAALGARLVSGFDEVARCVGLHQKLAGCDLCLTGEGRIDRQTLGGKVVAGVARLAGAVRVPTFALVGSALPEPGQTLEGLAAAIGLRGIVLITPSEMPLETALATAAANLREAARRVLAAWC